MNERIRQLAVEAGFPPQRSFSDLSDLYPRLDKFAELIVKECALIAGLMEFENRKNIGAAILDRFGVNDDKDSIT